VLELGTPSHPSTVQISGNYNGPDPFVSPKLTFLTKNTTTGSNTVSIEPSSVATADQSLVLPPAPGTAGQGLKAASVSSGDVLLEWYTPTDDNTTYTLSTKQNAAAGEIELTDSVSGSTPDSVTLTGAGGTSIASTTSGITVTSLEPGGLTGNIQFKTSTNTFDGSTSLTYTENSNLGRVALGSVGTTAGQLNIYGGQNNDSGSLSLVAPSDEGITFSVPFGQQDSYNVTFPGDTPANNQILQSNSSGDLSWIDTPTAGGIDSFNSLTVNTTTREADWNYSTDGVNVKLTPLDPEGVTPPTRTKLVVSGTWPNGAEGYLLVDSTNSNNFELPANSLIENGLPQAFSAGLTKYHFVYDGNNFLWSRENAMVAPT